MIVVGVTPALYWCHEKPRVWRFVCAGALAWAVAVALKFAWALPMNRIIKARLARGAARSVAEPLFWLYVGLLTGLFESGLAWLAARWLEVDTWENAVAFGIGFGAMEALTLGLLSFLGALVALISFDQIPPDKRANAEDATAVDARLMLASVERAAVLCMHVLACVLVVLALRTGQSRWFWSSIAFATAMDAFAMWGIDVFGVKRSIERLAWFNAMLVGLAFVSVAATALLRARFS
jgi:uncharacterized membrane protein YhfC